MSNTNNIDDVQTLISQRAQEHAQLLSQIQALDYAPSALSQSESNLTSLRKSQTKLTQQLESLTRNTKKEFKEWREYDSSKVTRALNRVRNVGRDSKGKLKERVDKEWKDYLEAADEERSTQNKLANLEVEIKKTEEEIKKLKELVNQHSSLSTQISSLYSSIFKGPTPLPNYPEEDQLETLLETSSKNYDLSQSDFNRFAMASSNLSRARECLRNSVARLEEARGWSGADMFGGGTFSDFLERSAIADAKTHAIRATQFVQQAQHSDPHINPLPKMMIADRDFFTDVFFDNPFTDYHFHQKIISSLKSVTAALIYLTEQLKVSTGRCEAAKKEAGKWTKEMRRVRRDLEWTRRRIMIEALGGQQRQQREERGPDEGDDLPPPVEGEGFTNRPSTSAPAIAANDTFSPPPGPPPDLLTGDEEALSLPPPPFDSEPGPPSEPPAEPSSSSRDLETGTSSNTAIPTAPAIATNGDNTESSEHDIHEISPPSDSDSPNPNPTPNLNPNTNPNPNLELTSPSPSITSTSTTPASTQRHPSIRTGINNNMSTNNTNNSKDNKSYFPRLGSLPPSSGPTLGRGLSTNNKRLIPPSNSDPNSSPNGGISSSSLATPTSSSGHGIGNGDGLEDGDRDVNDDGTENGSNNPSGGGTSGHSRILSTGNPYAEAMIAFVKNQDQRGDQNQSEVGVEVGEEREVGNENEAGREVGKKANGEKEE